MHSIALERLYTTETLHAHSRSFHCGERFASEPPASAQEPALSKVAGMTVLARVAHTSVFCLCGYLNTQLIIDTFHSLA